jgi:hypothetical protein
LSKDILEKNISAISKYNYSAIKLLSMDFSDTNDVVQEKNNEKCPTIYFGNNFKKYLLHSKYDPIKEAERLIEKIDFTKDSLIVVFGIGLGYHLLKLKDKISKDTRIFIVEHNVDILKYSLNNIDFTDIFNTPQFFLLFGDEAEIDQQVVYQVGSNFYNLAGNIQYIMLPNYYIYDKQNSHVMQEIRKKLSNYIVSFGNSLEDMLDGFRNNYRNIEALIKSNSIDEIKGKYKNKPAIIVASGPSLQKNIKYLKDAQGKALIISCDASLRACKLNGVKPDAVSSIERIKETYEYFYKEAEIDKDIVLLGPTLLWPQIYDEFKGKTIIMSKNNEGEEGWWASYFKNIEFVNQGQSCATVAFAVAKEAGCNPIILLGQDLAYTEGKIHSDITHEQFESENDEKEMDIDVVYMKDYNGNQIKSNWIYQLFKTWFEYQIIISPSIKVIDATEGGAYINGTEIMSLQEVIEKYCDETIDKRMIEHLSDIDIEKDEKQNKYSDLIIGLKKQIQELEKIKKISAVHYKILRNIENKYDFEKCNERDLTEIVIKMQPGDSVIQKVLNSKSATKEYFRQIIVQTIIHVKKIGNVINLDNVKRNYELQLSLMYMIKESSEVIIKEYNNALEHIALKKEQLKGEINEN